MTPSLTTLVLVCFGGFVAALLASLALASDALRSTRSRARLMRAVGRADAPAQSPHAVPLHTRTASTLLAWIARTGERFAALMGGEAKATADDLRVAGFRGRDALLVYAFVKTVVPAGAAVIGVASVLLSGAPLSDMVVPLGTALAAALALSKAVDIIVDRIRAARLARIARGIPDLLELLVISSEAGLGPQPALQRVGTELAHAHPDLAQEVIQMVSEMRLTNDRRAAYAALSARVPLPEIAIFTQSLDQSDLYGTPFSKAMRTLMAELRTNHMIRVEEKAARLPVLMTIPLIFCIMPAVFIVLIGPAALSILDNILGGS